jgi:restriction system protein
MMWPTLLALKELGDSASIEELNQKASAIAGFSDEQLSVLHLEGPNTEIEYRMAWARTYLKKVGALDNSSRGVWAITDIGRNMTQADLKDVPARVRAMASPRKTKPGANGATRADLTLVQLGADEPDEEDWKAQLLNVLQTIHPSSFEKLCQRILRESGFTQVEVTGRSGDGGIDGIGVLRIALLSFQVFFQCKRYKGSVGASAIRDFRGAMVGRTDKGLFITTGTFTPDAKREATRDGAPALDLIDGDALCDLLKERKLGVQTELVEQVVINTPWFESI